MSDLDLRALVIAAIGRRPTSDTERIIAYATKGGHSVSIPEVNAVLEQLKSQGYLSLAYPTRSDEVIVVIKNRLPQQD